MFLTDFRTRMGEAQAKHPTEALAAVVERITKIFDARVGEKPKPEQLAAIRKEGEDRYAKKIPPGYRDAKKDPSEGDKFGDLIIWKALIDKATGEKRPVIFISSNDVKEDWWHIHRGRKLGPRPELVEEFKTQTGQDFHIYELPYFLRVSAKRHNEISSESVDQIERSVLGDAEAIRLSKIDYGVSGTSEHILLLENERDMIISTLAGIPTIDGTRVRDTDKESLRIRLGAIEEQLGSVRKLIEVGKFGPPPDNTL